MKDKSQLRKNINDSAMYLLERMKNISADDRCSIFLEMGEWIFQEIDLDDELSVPTFKNDLQESGE